MRIVYAVASKLNIGGRLVHKVASSSVRGTHLHLGTKMDGSLVLVTWSTSHPDYCTVTDSARGVFREAIKWEKGTPLSVQDLPSVLGQRGYRFAWGVIPRKCKCDNKTTNHCLVCGRPPSEATIIAWRNAWRTIFHPRG